MAGACFVNMCRATFDRLYAESADGGRVFSALHPSRSASRTTSDTPGNPGSHLRARWRLARHWEQNCRAHYLADHYDEHVRHGAEVAAQAAEVAAAQARRRRACTRWRTGRRWPMPHTRMHGINPHIRAWNPLPRRKPLRWPGQRGLAVVPLINIESWKTRCPPAGRRFTVWAAA